MTYDDIQHIFVGYIRHGNPHYQTCLIGAAIDEAQWATLQRICPDPHNLTPATVARAMEKAAEARDGDFNRRYGLAPTRYTVDSIEIVKAGEARVGF